MAASEVSVGVCTRNRPHELERCLESIVESAFPVSQVIVSDDGDHAVAHRVRELCDAYGAQYLRGPSRGLCANRNHALGAVTGDRVLFLDDDARLETRFLDRVLARLDVEEARRGDANRVIVTGRERKPDGHVTAAREQSFLGFQEVLYADTAPMTTVVINAALFPAKLFAEISFDERILYGYDEVDLTTRAVAQGYRIVQEPEAVNMHDPSPSAREGYDRAADAARIYVTAKRYAFTDGEWARAAAFIAVAPVHLAAASVKAAGPRGLAGALSAVRTATADFVAARDDGERRRG